MAKELLTIPKAQANKVTKARKIETTLSSVVNFMKKKTNPIPIISCMNSATTSYLFTKEAAKHEPS